jgi:hypothetical protein
MPNQLFYLAVLLLFVWELPNALSRVRVTATVLGTALLFVGYVAAWAVVSLWEWVPGVTYRYLPTVSLSVLMLMLGTIWGATRPPKAIVTTMAGMLWPLVLMTSGEIIVSPDLTRFGYGPLAMLVLPATLALERYAGLAALILVMAASNHLTPLGAGLSGVAVFVWFRGHAVRTQLLKASIAATLLAGLMILTGSHGRILGTLNRLFEEDPTRTYLKTLFSEFIAISGGRGIGLMNVMALTEMDWVTEGRAAAGYFDDGVSLHSAYQTWLLEGGLLVTAAISLIMFRAIREVRVVLGADPLVGATLAAWMAALGVFGLYHQVQDAPQFWVTLGLTAGISSNYVRHRHPRLIIRNLRDNQPQLCPKQQTDFRSQRQRV